MHMLQIQRCTELQTHKCAELQTKDAYYIEQVKRQTDTADTADTKTDKTATKKRYKDRHKNRQVSKLADSYKAYQLLLFLD